MEHQRHNKYLIFSFFLSEAFVLLPMSLCQERGGMSAGAVGYWLLCFGFPAKNGRGCTSWDQLALQKSPGVLKTSWADTRLLKVQMHFLLTGEKHLAEPHWFWHPSWGEHEQGHKAHSPKGISAGFALLQYPHHVPQHLGQGSTESATPNTHSSSPEQDQPFDHALMGGKGRQLRKIFVKR